MIVKDVIIVDCNPFAFSPHLDNLVNTIISDIYTGVKGIACIFPNHHLGDLVQNQLINKCSDQIKCHHRTSIDFDNGSWVKFNTASNLFMLRGLNIDCCYIIGDKVNVSAIKENCYSKQYLKVKGN